MSRPPYDEPKLDELIEKEAEPKGLNLTQLKNSFLSLDKNNLYTKIYHYSALVVFLTLVWVYLSSNFNTLPEVYQANANQAVIFTSHQWLRICFLLSLIILVIAIIATVMQKKFNKILEFPMILIYLGNVMITAFILVSHSLYSFLKLYFNNTDPFKKFSTPMKVLSDLNYEFYGSFLITAIALLGLAFILLLMKKLNIKIVLQRRR